MLDGLVALDGQVGQEAADVQPDSAPLTSGTAGAVRSIRTSAGSGLHLAGVASPVVRAERTSRTPSSVTRTVPSASVAGSLQVAPPFALVCTS